MADDLKQDFIEAVRLTPDGISDFLTTPIPTPPSISTPSTVDEAIIDNGIAAKFVCDLFAPFAGLTPVELLLRIGQHNSVLESAMLAGLEYITETEEVNELEIITPIDSDLLTPGEILFSAMAKNGTLLQCAVEIEGYAPVSLEQDTDGTFDGYLKIEEEGEYTATFTGLFEKEKTATAITIFTLGEGGKPPGGDDKKALKRARDMTLAAYKNLIRYATVIEQQTLTAASAFEQAVNTFLGACTAQNVFVNNLKTTITSDLSRLLAALNLADAEQVKIISSSIMNAVNTLYTGVT